MQSAPNNRRRSLLRLAMAALAIAASGATTRAQTKTEAPPEKTNKPEAKPKAPPEQTTEPVPRPGSWMNQHEKYLDRARKGDIDLLFLGDSITAGWAGGGKG